SPDLQHFLELARERNDVCNRRRVRRRSVTKGGQFCIVARILLSAGYCQLTPDFRYMITGTDVSHRHEVARLLGSIRGNRTAGQYRVAGENDAVNAELEDPVAGLRDVIDVVW